MPAQDVQRSLFEALLFYEYPPFNRRIRLYTGGFFRAEARVADGVKLAALHRGKTAFNSQNGAMSNRLFRNKFFIVEKT